MAEGGIQASPAGEQSILVDAPASSQPKVFGASAVNRTKKAEAKDLPLNRVPGLTTRELLNLPKNLSRWHMGAVLYTANNGPIQPFNWRDADDGQSPGLLLGDDPSAEYDLTPDVYKYVIELNDYYLVNRFTFKNFTAVGTLQIYSSDTLTRSDSKAWKPLTEPKEFSGEGYVSARFDEIDAKYFMVVFDVTVEGSIGIFGLYGDMSVAETRIPRTRQDAETVSVETPQTSETTKFNFGSLATGSNVSHVSGGAPEEVKNMNDDDVETYFEFPEDAIEDVMIVDLAEQQKITRVSMLFESPPGTFDLYLTNDLPEGMEELDTSAAGSESTTGSPDSASTAQEPSNEDMASLWQGIPEDAILLAARPGSLGEWLALSTLVLGQQVTQVVLPKSFFENNEHAMEFEVDGSTGRFRADFEAIEMRYMIIRFTPTDGPGASPGSLRVFEVGVFGDVPEDQRRLVRIPVFEFFANGVDINPELTPTAGGDEGDDGSVPDGGGNLPQPPPVSP